MLRHAALDQAPSHADDAVRIWDASAGFDRADVLTSLNFRARRGELTAIVGPAGSGKTCLLWLLRLALAPRRGRLVVLGEPAARLDARRRALLKRRIGWAAEAPLFVEQWSAIENVAAPVRLSGRRRAPCRSDLEELMRFCGCDFPPDAPVTRLSPAARRALGLARALAARPDLILLDEPAAGLSEPARDRLMRAIAEIARLGPAVILATQDAEGVQQVAHAQWRLEAGRLQAIQTIAEEPQ